MKARTDTNYVPLLTYVAYPVSGGWLLTENPSRDWSRIDAGTPWLRAAFHIAMMLADGHVESVQIRAANVPLDAARGLVIEIEDNEGYGNVPSGTAVLARELCDAVKKYETAPHNSNHSV